MPLRSINAVMDASFLIDWVKYDNRDSLSKQYDIVFITGLP